MRPHTYHTRSGAWASVHHAGTSRVHWSPSAWPLSGGTHPPLDAVGSALHLQLQSASPSLLPPMCVHVPLPQPASGGLGSLSATTHPTAHAQPDHSNPKIYINLSILKLLTTAWCPFCMKWLPLGDVRYLKARSGRRLSACPRCGRHNLRFKPRFRAV